jgi:hypothetical protein
MTVKISEWQSAYFSGDTRGLRTRRLPDSGRPPPPVRRSLKD